MPSCFIEPVWDQFAALLPVHVDTHQLGCHRPRILDRVVVDKHVHVHVLVLGAAYEKVADSTCSRTTIPDCGTEMVAHLQVTEATGLPIAFCDPHSPWQRGSNENTVSV